MNHKISALYGLLKVQQNLKMSFAANLCLFYYGLRMLKVLSKSTLILPVFFVLKMSSAQYICCIYLDARQNTFTMEANTMNPDQTVPKGAV